MSDISQDEFLRTFFAAARAVGWRGGKLNDLQFYIILGVLLGGVAVAILNTQEPRHE